MALAGQAFPYQSVNPALGNASLMPVLPLTLVGSHSVATSGLVDSGAAINVLPYSIGLQPGFDWQQHKRTVALTGNLASVEARVVVASALIGPFGPVRQAFAWAKTDGVSLILGQVNFFLEFDICFYRTRSLFEVRPKQST